MDEPFLFRHFGKITLLVMAFAGLLAAHAVRSTNSCIDRVSETCAVDGIPDSECLSRVQLKCRLSNSPTVVAVPIYTR